MDKYGLVGRDIGYSFSQKFFNEKFRREAIEAEYLNFDLPEISEITNIIREEKNLKGLNVTIPYKEKIIPFLDEITSEAQEIGAINTIQFRNNRMIGHNTDVFGFKETLVPFLGQKPCKALILGTGGAAKAIAFVLRSMHIPFKFVSRKKKSQSFCYEQLSKEIIEDHSIIINCTPLGTFPNIQKYPPIPYSFLGKEHLLFDLIYNPPLSEFLKKGLLQGSQIQNGQKMLELQAKKAWSIWQSE